LVVSLDNRALAWHTATEQAGWPVGARRALIGAARRFTAVTHAIYFLFSINSQRTR
jgi:hypothetical protein